MTEEKKKEFNQDHKGLDLVEGQIQILAGTTPPPEPAPEQGETDA